jgi:hypothetical protein
MIFATFAEYSACPSSQGNYLQDSRTNLCFGIPFHNSSSADVQKCYMDPNLISSTSDKRKAPSLVAPPAVKKKRTTKMVPIEVTFLPS